MRFLSGARAGLSTLARILSGREVTGTMELAAKMTLELAVLRAGRKSVHFRLRKGDVRAGIRSLVAVAGTGPLASIRVASSARIPTRSIACTRTRLGAHMQFVPVVRV